MTKINCDNCSPKCPSWKKGKDTCRWNLRDLNKRIYGIDSEIVPVQIKKEYREKFRKEMRVELNSKRPSFKRAAMGKTKPQPFKIAAVGSVFMFSYKNLPEYHIPDFWIKVSDTEYTPLMSTKKLTIPSTGKPIIVVDKVNL